MMMLRYASLLVLGALACIAVLGDDPVPTASGDPVQTASGDPVPTASGDPVPTASGDPVPTAFGDPVTTSGQATGSPASFQRTVIMLERNTNPGNEVFFRGGISYEHRPECDTAEFKRDVSKSPCAIPIRHRDLDHVTGDTPAHDEWGKGDNFLDWVGAEPNQGKYRGSAAKGSPGQWTTNNPGSSYFSDLNKYNDHYWILDVDMDCSRTEQSFFEFKALLDGTWEGSSNLEQKCDGGQGREPPYQTTNHMARCGYVNVFHWNQKSCEIYSFEAFLAPPLD